jgi:hypothetical protein
LGRYGSAWPPFRCARSFGVEKKHEAVRVPFHQRRADSLNPKLEADLTKRAGRKPDLLFDQHIRTLLTAEPAPTREMTSAYRLSEADAQALTQAAVAKIRESGFFFGMTVPQGQEKGRQNKGCEERVQTLSTSLIV